MESEVYWDIHTVYSVLIGWFPLEILSEILSPPFGSPPREKISGSPFWENFRNQ